MILRGYPVQDPFTYNTSFRKGRKKGRKSTLKQQSDLERNIKYSKWWTQIKMHQELILPSNGHHLKNKGKIKKFSGRKATYMDIRTPLRYQLLHRSFSDRKWLTSKMAWWEKTLTATHDNLSSSWKHHNGGRKLNPTSCLLTTTLIPWHMYA